MAVEHWNAGHQVVFNAFKKQLPTGEALRKIITSSLNLDRNKRPGREVIFEQYGAAAIKELGDNADKLLTDFLAKPAEHHLSADRWDDENVMLNKIASVLAGVYCERNPSQYSAEALIRRLKMMFANPKDACEIAPSWRYSENRFYDRYLFPKAKVCLRILSKHSQFEDVKRFLYSTFQGDYNVRLDHGEDAYIRFEDTCNTFIGSEYDRFDDFVQALFKAGQLTYEWFEAVIKLYPHYMRVERVFPEKDEDDDAEADLSPAFADTYQTYVKRLIKDQISQLPDSAKFLDDIVGYTGFRGIEWIQLGLERIETLALKAKDLKEEYGDFAKVIRRLIGIEGLAQGETEQDLVAMLAQFKEPVLLIALPYAGYARNSILKALGWDDLLQLQQQLFNIAGGHPGTTESLNDVYNCESTVSGVIDRPAVAEALQTANEKRINKYCKALRASSLEVKNTLMLITAVMDIERDKVEKKLVRHGQAAIKAFGLYPIASEEELRERYLKLKAMHKEATQYGPERQANTQAAVKAGLKNLAQTAGYSDDIRLEWAMEADIASSMIPFDQPFEVDAWTVKLVLEGITPRIQVSKQEKPLKSVPPKVRQTDVYKQMRDAQDTIRGQASRFRKTLEDMMCNGEVIDAQELKTLNRLPIVRAMLTQLIMKTGDGTFGLFNGSEDTLTGLDGELVPAATNLSIAHVYQLFEAGLLSQWQKAIVKRRMVQPFKQAFRELYVVTPAEVDAGTHSRRFIGHVVDSGITSRLLQSRGWSQSSGDVAEVYKRFPAHGMYAEIGFPDSRHYLAEDATVTIDEIWFRGKNKDIPLEQIEPMIFSEVMRDVDLIASVAQVDNEDIRWSTESAQRRAELIATLVDEVGLTQVRCEDHFAYVQGKRANYRIHLGSGVIHIQPGNYLCIVPQRNKEESLYLPFADTDLRMAEIVSKIFMLVSDDKITDKTILAQIEASVNG
ncbi:MAG: DUF4132 domain-containing protein [Candidatus Competibacteraceae bacterium]|jgi:hypothetical protein|nr:DUF4132 domain-containing protein [Candidatus Competibacteraceae bacterium]